MAPGPLPLRLTQVEAPTPPLPLRLTQVGVPHPAWKTLRAWWLSGPARDYTSVSFLIDRKGLIRYIHPGGKYARGDKEHDEEVHLRGRPRVVHPVAVRGGN